MKFAILMLLLGANQALGMVDGIELETTSESFSVVSTSHAWVLVVLCVLAFNLWVAFGGRRKKWNDEQWSG